MGRLTKDVQFKKRGKIWYCKLKGMEHFKTTGETSRTNAEKHVNRILQKQGFSSTTEMPFSEYAEPFFDWERCPHIRRLLDEDKTVTKRYADIQRMNLKKYILPSNLRLLKMNEIKRAHIIDFRSTLRKKSLSSSTVNKIMSCLKVIFNEALFREDILYNPVQLVGNIKDNSIEIDIFTSEELKKLFPLDFKSVWKDELDFTCFFLTASTGMRRGEVLALRWEHIHFEEEYIAIAEAWKSRYTIGKPKWENRRNIVMSQTLKKRLLKYWENSLRRAPDDLIFSYADGSRLGETWWKKHFDNALLRAGIDRDGRRLRPHSFRHSLNTILLDKGNEPEKVRAALGWKDSAVQERYTHWIPEHFKKQAEIIDSIWAV